MTKEKLTPARKRITAAIDSGNWDHRSLSLALGKSHAYIQQYLKRGSPRVLPEDIREKLAELIGGDPNDYRDDGLPASAPRHYGETILSVPIFDVDASAGDGSLSEDSSPIGWQPFREQELGRLTRTDTEHLAVIRVKGDSMWETLHNGDHVLVDRTVSRIVKDGIYVILFEDELLVKRCNRDLDSGKVIVQSDNPKYRASEVGAADKLTVYGRVIWIGRALG